MKEEKRDSFVKELKEIKKSNDQLIVFVRDSTSTCRINPFLLENPDSVVNVGIAEQNMIGIAAGLSLGGFIPVTANAACFLLGRSNEQVKVDICYAQTNVKVVGLNPGFAYGSLGPTHHNLDDISTMLAFGGIGGVAVGLASKDLLANFFGAVMIYLDRPFPSVTGYVHRTEKSRVQWRGLAGV